jgi:hypothetical protein
MHSPQNGSAIPRFLRVRRSTSAQNRKQQYSLCQDSHIHLKGSFPDVRGDAHLVDSTVVGEEWKGRLETNCCSSKDARFGGANVIETYSAHSKDVNCLSKLDEYSFRNMFD